MLPLDVFLGVIFTICFELLSTSVAQILQKYIALEQSDTPGYIFEESE